MATIEIELLGRLFNRKQKGLSKVEYWKKWEFFELLDDLHKAEKLLQGRTGGYSGSFLSAEEFREALRDEIDSIEYGNKNDLKQIYLWFAPTTQWDDFAGPEGLDLGNRIFERVLRWKEGTK